MHAHSAHSLQWCGWASRNDVYQCNAMLCYVCMVLPRLLFLACVHFIDVIMCVGLAAFLFFFSRSILASFSVSLSFGGFSLFCVLLSTSRIESWLWPLYLHVMFFVVVVVVGAVVIASIDWHGLPFFASFCDTIQFDDRSNKMQQRNVPSWTELRVSVSERVRVLVSACVCVLLFLSSTTST